MSRARTVPLRLIPDARSGAPAPVLRADAVVPVEPLSSSATPDRWESSPCSQLVLDSSAGAVLAANQTFWDWSGLQRAEVLGTPFARLLPVGDRILWSTHCLPKLEAAGRVDEVSVEVIGAGGVRRAAFLSASRVGAEQEGHVLVALFGAAERRRYEEDLLAAKRRAEASEAQRVRAEARLQHLAHHDPVTGLLNRRGLHAALLASLVGEETLEGSVHPATSAADQLVVFFIDLDGFKQVNDSTGHAGGDELLATVAERLRATVRPGAELARFAGDEFVVLDALPAGGDDAVLADVCQRVLAALARPVVISGVEVVVSASIGVARAADCGALAAPVDREEWAEDLLHRADAAMYAVKRSGRSGWRVHDPDASDPAADRLRLLEQLRHGVADGQLRLHHQPRVDLASGRTTGVEALVRWQHPERGLLPPAEFIEVAEESGLVRELGAWVLEAAVAQAAAWNAAGRSLEVSVNVSARQLADPALPSTVVTALTRHGVPASQLVLEITETALMLDPVAASATLRHLADLGVRIAVDDFGTGYASFTYLRRFPVHELKVDRSFVDGVARDSGDRAIVATCLQLAHALGLTSVAEGVETHEQLDALTELGCHVAQGYLFGRPVPAELLRR